MSWEADLAGEIADAGGSEMTNEPVNASDSIPEVNDAIPNTPCDVCGRRREMHWPFSRAISERTAGHLYTFTESVQPLSLPCDHLHDWCGFCGEGIYRRSIDVPWAHSYTSSAPEHEIEKVEDKPRHFYVRGVRVGDEPAPLSPITIERDTLQSVYDLLMGTWVGAPCERGCGCVLHSLRAALRIEEADDATSTECVRCKHAHGDRPGQCYFGYADNGAPCECPAFQPLSISDTEVGK